MPTSKQSENNSGHENSKARRDSQSRSTARSRRSRERHISVRGELRDKPDLQKIARAVVALAMAQAEADAQALSPSLTEHKLDTDSGYTNE